MSEPSSEENFDPLLEDPEKLLDEEPLASPLDTSQITAADRVPEPEEATSSLEAIDQLLEPSLIVPEPMPALDAPFTGSSPFFQVQVSVQKHQEEAWQKICRAHSLEKSNLFTKLTEYQAISLAMDFREAHIRFSTALLWPESLANEENTALGSLLGIPELENKEEESAPSVYLPAHHREVFLFTGKEIPGFHLKQILSLVTAHRSLPQRFFREAELQEQMNKELTQLGNSSVPASKAQSLFRDLFLDIQKNAVSQGGNAVLALRIEGFPETIHTDPGLEQLRLVAFGTAAVVEKL